MSGGNGANGKISQFVYVKVVGALREHDHDHHAIRYDKWIEFVLDLFPILLVALERENEIGRPSRDEEGNEIETIVTD